MLGCTAVNNGCTSGSCWNSAIATTNAGAADATWAAVPPDHVVRTSACGTSTRAGPVLLGGVHGGYAVGYTTSPAMEYIVLEGKRLPSYSESYLRTLSLPQLREHALLLHSVIGQQYLISSLPQDTELLNWILDIQRIYLDPNLVPTSHHSSAPTLDAPLEPATHRSKPGILVGSEVNGGDNAVRLLGGNHTLPLDAFQYRSSLSNSFDSGRKSSQTPPTSIPSRSIATVAVMPYLPMSVQTGPSMTYSRPATPCRGTVICHEPFRQRGFGCASPSGRL